MFKISRQEIEWGGKKLVLETGKVGRQADGSVIATLGETVVHCAVCGSKEPPADSADFFPLTVNYTEKAYAAGKIPGGFFKREGKPSETEVLISRLIDRPIRPLFADGFKNEVQVTVTLLAYDEEAPAEIVAMIAASAALTISGLPFLGPIASCKVGYIDGKYVLNPSKKALVDSKLELVVAGTKEGVLMVESEAKELTEAEMLGAVKFGHESFMPVIDAIIALAEDAAKEPWEIPEKSPLYGEMFSQFETQFGAELANGYKITEKKTRRDTIDGIYQKIIETLGEDEEKLKLAPGVFHDLEKKVMRANVLNEGIRIDGRDTKTVRPIVAEVGFLPKVHGSALFTRGETQALVVATLGTGQDEQIVDSLGGEYKEPFMLHYNFPSFSVGEVKRAGSPGRREIGHGKLAWRAIHPMLPDKESFPYTLRVVSEITESNGSSSMATVCGSTLALMDAGVPMKKPVAGVAMGLIKESDKFVVLTDIMGDEDHLGDMDFKVAGTKDGVTALQMDIKITSITYEIMETALKQAKDGRMHILGKMAEALPEPRPEISKNAPRIISLNIPKDKIREVIGTGGKVIREITEKTGCKIDITDDGVVKIASVDESQGKQALEWIKGIVSEPEVGVIYTGKVVKIMDFGAFVNFLGDNDGLVHISELRPEKVAKVTDVVKEGDIVKVKLIGIDNRGKIKLSMKRVDQNTGADLEAVTESEA